MANCAREGQMCLPLECERSGAELFRGKALAGLMVRNTALPGRNNQLNSGMHVETWNRGRERYYLSGKS